MDSFRERVSRKYSRRKIPLKTCWRVLLYGLLSGFIVKTPMNKKCR